MLIAIAVRVVINALAFYAAAYLVDGITLSSELTSVLLAAFVFGLINAVIKPVAKLFALPLVLLTLGLFIFVVNAGMLLLTDWLTSGITIDGWWTAIIGAVVISIVSWILSIFLPDGSDR